MHVCRRPDGRFNSTVATWIGLDLAVETVELYVITISLEGLVYLV